MVLTGDYSWTETKTLVKVLIPLHNTSAKATDILTTSNFLKVSYGGWLVALDLFGEVVDGKGSKAVVKDGVLTVKMTKKTKGLWGQLTVGEDKPKDWVEERRRAGMEEREKRVADMEEKARDKAIEEERMALKKQMALEQKERQDIDDLKEEEKLKAEEEVYQTFADLERQEAEKNSKKKGFPIVKALAPAPAVVSAPAPEKKTKKKKKKYEDDDSDDDSDEENRQGSAVPAPIPSSSTSSSIWESNEIPTVESNPEDGFDLDRDALLDDDIDSETEDPEVDDTIYDNEDLDDLDKQLPPPRQSAHATFKYTPRLFKTPMRESTVNQEKDFIAKNRPHLHNHGLLNKDALDISETDPVWLKGKGDDFFRSGDFRSAINAYSSAFESHDKKSEISKAALSALANRAACYLKIGEPARTIADVDDALRLSSNAQNLDLPGGLNGFWLKCFVRRGTARCQLGDFDNSRDDYKRAYDLDNTNEGLKEDYEKMKELAEVSNLKKSADTCFGEGKIDGAIDLYSRAIERDQRFVSAVSNRAGALLAKGMYEDCIADCDSALNMLANLGSTSGPVPPPGSEKRRDWVIRTVCRRAKAKSELGIYKDAVTDMEMALKMVPEGRQKVRDDLEEDIEVLRGMVDGGKQ
ncbi:hypothetical protein TrCOL_g2427 [Triparma columacea]|uniref:CS domain-containing protein n=1 Tax=Triparma columacea TaxID=722753 RepID=A0A9W7GR15_9STRA|nr:hypothetical protein TrCOL_g2427 [Triparma columacea]